MKVITIYMHYVFDFAASGSESLRALYSELTTMFEPRIVAANMYQRNALTLKELQSIQSLRDRQVEAAETLLNIIIEQPDAVYLCFLDVLKDTEQHHIYERLVADSYKGSCHPVFLLRFGNETYRSVTRHMFV